MLSNFELGSSVQSPCIPLRLVPSVHSSRSEVASIFVEYDVCVKIMVVCVKM